MQLCSLLPMAAPAMVRENGEIWLGLQVQHDFGDPTRDLGAVLRRRSTPSPGMVGLTDAPGEGPRLQDLVAAEPLDDHRARRASTSGSPTWTDAEPMAAALEQANDAGTPPTG